MAYIPYQGANGSRINVPLTGERNTMAVTGGIGPNPVGPTTWNQQAQAPVAPAYGLRGANIALGQNHLGQIGSGSGLPGANAALGMPNNGYGLQGANATLGQNHLGQIGSGSGLAGANAALGVGSGTATRSSLDAIGNGGFGGIWGAAKGAIGQADAGRADVQPWIKPGIKAHDIQAALSGSLGQAAQQQAYDNFRSSPAQQWLQEQSERALLRNSSAIGGLGGGNVRQELQRQAQGLASQDYQQQYANMGTVADRGMQGQDLANQMRQAAAAASSAAGGHTASLSGALSNASAGVSSANIAAQTALRRDAGQYAFQSGQDIANNIYATTGGLAQYRNQLGQGTSGLVGNHSGQLSQILNNLGIGQGQSGQQWAQMLGNLASNSSGQVAGLPGLGGATPNNGLANIGSLLGGAGLFMGGMG